MKPLTIEDLKNLEVGDWVWFKSLISDASFYVRVELNCSESITVRSIYTIHNRTYAMYGKTWLAYKNKEQAEAKGEIVELPEPFIGTDKNAYGETTYLVFRSKIDTYCPSEDIYLDKTEAERRLAELKGEL